MKKSKLMAAIAATTMAVTTMISFSASAATRSVYMLGDVDTDLRSCAIDASIIMSALENHGFEKGNRVSVSYVQKHLNDWFPNAVCAKAADANQDGYISHDDAQDILQYSANVGAGNDGYKNIGKYYVYIEN